MIDIYVIEDEGIVVYVGQSVNVAERQKQHRRTAKRSNRHLYVWIREHPNWAMRVVETVETSNEARTAERAWVRKYLSEGIELMNVTYGDKKHVEGTEEDRLRTKRSRALAKKRKNAAKHGITLVEGAIVAVRGNEFSVYEWDEVNEDYVPRYTGVLDTFKK